ncbi:MAG: 2-C-methyl-D-erythritol 2,4-cyclodiphosphate synthase [Bacillota bacterium]
MRIGIGYDVHRLAQKRRLVLGGVEIPFPRGLEGHSDADVLIHAIIDALLGAAGLGDIGVHFPDTDPAYRGIDSCILLKEVSGKLDAAGWEVGNIDATVAAQKPKLAPYINDMRLRLSGVLNLASGLINIKAKTTEGLGFEGRGEGISAYAAALLVRKS